MNIYFFRPSCIQPQYFSYLAEALKVYKFYILSNDINPTVKEYCKEKEIFSCYLDAFTDAHKRDNINRIVYDFVDQLRKNGTLLDFYKDSSNNPLANLQNNDLDDHNIMMIMPEKDAIDWVLKYSISGYANHFAQYTLNLLRKAGDDRYAERLAFLYISPTLQEFQFYKRLSDNYNSPKKGKVSPFSYNRRNIFCHYLINKIIELHPDFKDECNYEGKDFYKHYWCKLIGEDDKIWKKRDEYEDDYYNNNPDYSPGELEDMYNDAFEGDSDYLSNID